MKNNNLKNCFYENIIDDIIWEVRHEDVYEIKEYLEKILYN